jgi:putative transposase
MSERYHHQPRVQDCATWAKCVTLGIRHQQVIRDTGIEVIRLPPMSPNLNAYAERFVRSIKDECLSRMIFIGQASLRRAVSEYMDHYHRERNHQGIGNRVICAPAVPESSGGQLRRRARLGGLLNFYYHAAA